MKPLIEQLPRHYQTSQQDAELQRALTVLLTQVQADLDFTLKQLIPSTASGRTSGGAGCWPNSRARA